MIYLYEIKISLIEKMKSLLDSDYLISWNTYTNWNRRIAIPPRLEMIYRLKQMDIITETDKKFELLKWFKYDFEISNIIWLRTLLRHDSIYWSDGKTLLTIRRDFNPKGVQIFWSSDIQPKRRRQMIRCPTYYQVSRHCSLCNVMFGAKIYLITYFRGFVSILYRLQTIIISLYRDQE